MWCNNQKKGATAEASTSTDNLSITKHKDEADREQTIPTAIAIIEPRKKLAGISGGSTCTSTTNSTTTASSANTIRPPLPEWSILPQDVDVNNDIVRLVSSLSNVIQILIRMSNTAAHELLLHPEREEDFEGLRLLLNYADQMYSTLLQPQTNSGEQSSAASSNRNGSTIPTGSLFHHLFEPMLAPLEARQQESSNRSLTRSARIVAGVVEVTEPDSNSSEPTNDTETETRSVP